ncbi:hypothetical protein AA313_de0201973 [Arthrobotrys entomopaga]|nr:hypothetical protein AA313_de0201973 [Arthrobotrys entomopaga]
MSAINFQGKFNGENWEAYKEYILQVIEAAGAKDLIQESSFRPTIPPNMDPLSESHTPTQRTPGPEIVSSPEAEWGRLDSETRRTILESCDDTRKEELEGITTAFEMWRTLREKYDMADTTTPTHVTSPGSENDSGDSDRSLEVRRGGRWDMADPATFPPLPIEIRLKTITPGPETDHWERHLDSIMALLDRYDIPWGVVHLGILDGEATVVVIHSEGGSWDRTTMEAEFRGSLLPLELFPRMEFLPGEVKKAGALAANAYDTPTLCGASIGVLGVNWSAGKLGGYLESDGDIVYGLTCHHVALPTKAAESDSKGKLANTEYPSYLDGFQKFHKAFDKSNGEIIIAQPSCSDHGDTLEGYRSIRNQWVDSLEKIKFKYEMLNKPADASRIKILEAKLKSTSEELDRLSQIERKFGRLVASSGYGVDQITGHSLDWAIFELLEPRMGINMVTRADKKGWGILKDDLRIIFNSIADPGIGEKVYKVGKQSGVTFGIINSIRDGVSLWENGCNSKE